MSCAKKRFHDGKALSSCCRVVLFKSILLLHYVIRMPLPFLCTGFPCWFFSPHQICPALLLRPTQGRRHRGGAGGAAAPPPKKNWDGGGAPSPKRKNTERRRKMTKVHCAPKKSYYQCVTGVTRPLPQSKFGADAPATFTYSSGSCVCPFILLSEDNAMHRNV